VWSLRKRYDLGEILWSSGTFPWMEVHLLWGDYRLFNSGEQAIIRPIGGRKEKIGKLNT
jgi:hypothetical protein